MPVIYYWSVGVSLTYFRDITIVYDAECPSPVHSDSDIVENEKQRNMAFISLLRSRAFAIFSVLLVVESFPMAAITIRSLTVLGNKTVGHTRLRCYCSFFHSLRPRWEILNIALESRRDIWYEKITSRQSDDMCRPFGMAQSTNIAGGCGQTTAAAFSI